MATGAPTNDCYADFAPSANSTLTEMITLPLGFPLITINSIAESCSPTTAGSSAVGNAFFDRLYELQQSISSIDLSFEIPDHPALSNNNIGGTYRVSLPDASTHASLAMGASAGILAVAFATIIYYALYNNKTRGNNSTLKKAVIGSTLLPVSLLLPYAINDMLGVQNTAARFATSILFVLYMFRILEAVFDFVPPGAKASLGTYCTYFSLPFDMIFDGIKPVMATKQEIRDGQINVVKAVTCIGVLCTILTPSGYKPFGDTDAGEFNESIVLSDYLDLKHLGNCFAIALFFQQGLSVGDAVFGNAIQTVLGYKVKQTMRNPMLEATSPSDFWGRRWNVLVHSVMKRGVYKPVRKYSSSPVAASLAVFIASGLFHEWLVHVVFLHNRPSSSSTSEVLLGSNTAFFVWNFVIIVSEKVLTGTKGVKSLGKMIPSLLLPFAIIMTSLPMAHWFGNPYLKGGFFEDYEKCLILIRKL